MKIGDDEFYNRVRKLEQKIKVTNQLNILQECEYTFVSKQFYLGWKKRSTNCGMLTCIEFGRFVERLYII